MCRRVSRSAGGITRISLSGKVSFSIGFFSFRSKKRGEAKSSAVHWESRRGPGTEGWLGVGRLSFSDTSIRTVKVPFFLYSGVGVRDVGGYHPPSGVIFQTCPSLLPLFNSYSSPLPILQATSDVSGRCATSYWPLRV